MKNEPNQITFDELYAHQERLCQQSLAQLIRLSQWKENGIIYDNQEVLVGENAEVLNSLQRKKEKRKQPKYFLSMIQKSRHADMSEADN